MVQEGLTESETQKALVSTNMAHGPPLYVSTALNAKITGLDATQDIAISLDCAANAPLALVRSLIN